jgi:hypothetical protein
MYQDILQTIYGHYQPYLQKDEDGLILVDPVDKKVIGFHYGETHMGGAFILGGLKHGKSDMVETGVAILYSFFAHAKEYEQNPAYHWDFNNFALCTIYEYLEITNQLPELQERIKEFILVQQDSNNATINWHPMRIYVNQWKYEWTRDEKYKSLAESLGKKIVDAQYDDGFVEDLLPKGTSFNFQYHMFTTAMLAYLKARGTEIADFNNAASRAIDMMDANGDINYLGRGNNQIFAWGPAIYLYSLVSPESLLKAWEYIKDRSLIAIQNDNLIVNEFRGQDKGWWWDYHFCSVYIAHYAFWLMLTEIEDRKIEFKYKEMKADDSGVHIHNGKYYIATFDGRKHYLAESGKVISNISCESKTFFKGAFGPYYKEYGFKYSSPADSLHNFIGILKTRKVLGTYTEKAIYPDDIEVSDDKITLYYRKPVKGVINVAWFDERPPVVKVGEAVHLRLTSKFKGPYGWVNLFQSKEVKTDRMEVLIGE